MAGAIGHFRSAKSARVSANGVIMKEQEWNVTQRGDDLDTTCFETGGQEQGTIGIQGLDYDIKGQWNAQQNPQDSPPGIFPQDAFPNLNLYPDSVFVPTTFWSIPFARIISCQNGAPVRQMVTFNWSGKSQPGWLAPTGSA